MPAKVVAREFTGDESTLRQRSARIVRALVDLDITHAVGVPDNATRLVYEMLENEPGIQIVPVCREGEAWAIASGLWVGGRCPVVIIQNTGFLESGDGLRGTAIEMGVPLLSIIDYRGYQTLGTEDPDSAAGFFEPTLRAWGVPYQFLEEGREAEVLRAARASANALERPVAVLMT